MLLDEPDAPGQRLGPGPRDAGVARSPSAALAWCVRLVVHHQDEWRGELREAMSGVADVRAKGPQA